MDKWLKRVWLANGVLLLLTFLVVGAVLFRASFRGSSRAQPPLPGPQASPQSTDRPVTQDITLSLPKPVGRTGTVYVEIGVRDLSEARSGDRVGIPDMRRTRSMNLLFAGRDGSGPRLLLGTKGFITGLDIPALRDSLQAFCLYEIALRDTDRDGRLTAKDSTDLFISNLDGQDLTPVLPAGVECTEYAKPPEGKELLLLTRGAAPGSGASVRQAGEQLQIYDVTTCSLRAFLADAASLEEAQRILWAK